MAAKAVAVPARHELTTTRLGNGLRVVLAPDRSVPVVGIAVLYDVGMRSEPEGRTGFAHLFEHLMFQGSQHVAKMEHARYVQSAGGVFNGSTHVDYTNYFEAMPSNALERGLFLEADRMAGPQLTETNLANQIAVVKEEIRVNVLNRPYGGFPWLYLPGVLFDTFPNAHNGYGEFADLEAATVGDAEDFFARYYAPANAVLAVAGDFAVDEATTLVERHFGAIGRRKAAVRPDFGEPWRARPRRASHPDAHAPMPAVALGFRVPDPAGLSPQFLAHALLCELLADGDAARLARALLHTGLATDIAAYVGEFGEPFDERDPMTLTIMAYYADAGSRARLIGAIDGVLDALATEGPAPGELDRVRTKFLADQLRDQDAVLNRALNLAKFELVHGSAQVLDQLPGALAAVAGADIMAAARSLRDQHRAELDLVPGGAR
jgi:predicted Zn-dependent peptidase